MIDAEVAHDLLAQAQHAWISWNRHMQRHGGSRGNFHKKHGEEIEAGYRAKVHGPRVRESQYHLAQQRRHVECLATRGHNGRIVGAYVKSPEANAGNSTNIVLNERRNPDRSQRRRNPDTKRRLYFHNAGRSVHKLTASVVVSTQHCLSRVIGRKPANSDLAQTTRFLG